MRDYGKIHSSFWTSPDIRSMTEDGRTLAAYLLTSPHSNMLGCFRIPLAYVSDDLQWPLERVNEGFAELLIKGFATLSKGSNWVVIHKFLKWNQPENPNVVRAAEKLFAQIPSNSGVKPILAWAIAEFEPRFSVDKLTDSKPFSNPFETLREAYRKPEPEPEPEPDSSEQKGFDLMADEPIDPGEPPVAELPLVDGSKHPVRADEVQAWERAYPAVNVPAELLRMGVWLGANPRKRKTARGVNAFIVAWLTRTQDTPRRGTGTDGAVDEHGVPL